MVLGGNRHSDGLATVGKFHRRGAFANHRIAIGNVPDVSNQDNLRLRGIWRRDLRKLGKSVRLRSMASFDTFVRSCVYCYSLDKVSWVRQTSISQLDKNSSLIFPFAVPVKRIAGRKRRLCCPSVNINEIDQDPDAKIENQHSKLVALWTIIQ